MLVEVTDTVAGAVLVLLTVAAVVSSRARRWEAPTCLAVGGVLMAAAAALAFGAWRRRPGSGARWLSVCCWSGSGRHGRVDCRRRPQVTSRPAQPVAGGLAAVDRGAHVADPDSGRSRTDLLLVEDERRVGARAGAERRGPPGARGGQRGRGPGVRSPMIETAGGTVPLVDASGRGLRRPLDRSDFATLTEGVRTD